MARGKVAVAAPAAAGTVAYGLAREHQAALEARLPQGSLDRLAHDLAVIGADPRQTASPALVADRPPAPPLEEAMASVTLMITAIRGAVQGAGARPELRRAYGVSTKAPSSEAGGLIAEGEKMAARAEANGDEARLLGILPADVASLQQALAGLKRAEEATQKKPVSAPVNARAKKAAEARVEEAVARIAGTGTLAFAMNAAVRAQFEALKPTKKA
jgi:hypothetical protein